MTLSSILYIKEQLSLWHFHYTFSLTREWLKIHSINIQLKRNNEFFRCFLLMTVYFTKRKTVFFKKKELLIVKSGLLLINLISMWPFFFYHWTVDIRLFDTFHRRISHLVHSFYNLLISNLLISFFSYLSKQERMNFVNIKITLNHKKL